MLDAIFNGFDMSEQSSWLVDFKTQAMGDIHHA